MNNDDALYDRSGDTQCCMCGRTPAQAKDLKRHEQYYGGRYTCGHCTGRGGIESDYGDSMG